MPQLRYGRVRPLLEERPQRTELGSLQGNSGGHCMSAALNQQTGVDRFANQVTKVKTRNGTA